MPLLDTFVRMGCVGYYYMLGSSISIIWLIMAVLALFWLISLKDPHRYWYRHAPAHAHALEDLVTGVRL